MKKNDFHGKAIYEPSGKAAEYSNWACNLYNGCPHSCTYCFNDHNIMAGSSFTAEFRPQDLTKRLIFGGSALTLKGSTYMIFSTKFPVGIISID